MKKQTGVWIDSKQAIIVALDGKNEKIETIESNVENRVHHDQEGDKGSFMGSQHISSERTFEETKKHQMSDFVGEIISRINQADELFVFGPSEAKLRLKQEIEENHSLKEKLKGVETADSMTENQIAAKVRDYFKV